MKTIKIFLAVGLLVMMVGSCKKSTQGSSNFGVRMTDAPGNFSAVYIDLQSVAVTGDAGGEVTLNARPGIYNLLDFTNGIDTLIATGSLQVGSVEQIRLILGPNNSVVVDGVTYPLSTPSAQQSGLKLQVHQALQAGVSYSMLVDFDANQSIIQQGNGTYQLKPVCRVIESAITGSIKGTVTPVGTLVIVTATLNGVSYSSVTQHDGEFLLKGVPAGVYTVVLTPSFPLAPMSVSNVVVSTGITTTLATVSF